MVSLYRNKHLPSFNFVNAHNVCIGLNKYRKKKQEQTWLPKEKRGEGSEEAQEMKDTSECLSFYGFEIVELYLFKNLIEKHYVNMVNSSATFLNSESSLHSWD